jgi:O-acetyl-ADP-ribose deacetylase (regulator of RNase III)
MISYLVGDATAPVGVGPKVIAHICNDVGRWGRGFVVAVSRRWPAPEAQYRRLWQRTAGECLPLGDVQFVEVARDLWVANMIAQHDVRMDRHSVPPIRYEALAACLRKVAESAGALNASVHMPRIGCGLAGGRWEEVEPIIIEELCAQGVPVMVYDLPNGGKVNR